MPSNGDIRLPQLAGEIEAVQLVLVAYLAGIADASPDGRHRIESVFRLAGKLAETTGELAGGDQRAERARRVQTAIEELKALAL